MSAAQRFASDVVGVLVLYGRSLDESETFRTLDRALTAEGARLTLLVWDNSPTASPLPTVDPTRWDLRYVHDAANPGVSTAYRAGAELAERLGRRWLLCLDQDTCVPEELLARYADASATHPEAVLLAPTLVSGAQVISPCGYRRLRGRALATPLAPGKHALVGRSVLNSGMCVTLAAYRAAGGHDPEIPLDFSDHEFVTRLAHVHPDFVLVAARCAHGLSAAEWATDAQRLRRFAAWCRGARRATRGPAERVAGTAFMFARATVLAWRRRSLAFLTVAVGAARGHD